MTEELFQFFCSYFLLGYLFADRWRWHDTMAFIRMRLEYAMIIVDIFKENGEQQQQRWHHRQPKKNIHKLSNNCVGEKESHRECM